MEPVFGRKNALLKETFLVKKNIYIYTTFLG